MKKFKVALMHKIRLVKLQKYSIIPVNSKVLVRFKFSGLIWAWFNFKEWAHQSDSIEL